MSALRTASYQLIYRARYVLPMGAPLLEDGGVAVQDGLIVAVGTYVDLKRQCSSAVVRDLGEVILMPGLINAHCHLEYTTMHCDSLALTRLAPEELPSAFDLVSPEARLSGFPASAVDRYEISGLKPTSSFTSWIQELNKIKFSLQEEDVIAAIVKGCEELSSSGCTTLGNIVSFPKLLSQLPSSPLRFWQLIEVMDIRGSQQGAEGLKVAEDFLKLDSKHWTDRKMLFGISPHAPQTSSPGLYRAAVQLAQQYRIPFCTHLAESEEEFEMLTQGRGQLFDFLKSLGRDMSDCGFQTPVQALLTKDLLPRGALLVHMNCLDAQDRELLTQRSDDFFIVHCPGTHRFFARAPFNWKFFYDHGYRLLLGTDSLASNDTLNLFSEMQLFAATAPELAPQEILNMVTLHPAEALGMRGKLGELSAGALADMIAIPFEGNRNDVAQAVLQNKALPMVI